MAKRKQSPDRNHIETLELYFKFIDLAQNTEFNRWTRFNNILLIDAIFLAAWSTVYAKDGLDNHQIVLVILCVPGVILSFIWSWLGARTNLYHQYYIQEAKKIESGSSKGIPKIMTEADKHSKGGTDLFSRSSIIVQYVPLGLGLLFLFLLVISLCPNKNSLCECLL